MPAAPLRRISLAIWVAGLLIVGLVAFVATSELVRQLRQIVIHFPGATGRSGLLAVLLGTLIGLACVAVVVWLAAWRSERWSFITAMVVLIGLRLVAVILIDIPVTQDDPFFQNQLALGVLDGNCCFAHRPMGYPITLAGAYAVFGTQVAVAELLNLAFNVLTGCFIYDLARRVWGLVPAAATLAVYAVMPSQILLVPVTLTETMYATLLAGAIWAAVALPARTWLSAAVAAVFLALSQYVRATSMALVPALLLVPLLRGDAWRQVVRCGLITIVVFVAVLLPVVEFNLRAHHELSLSTSSYAGWTLYVGTNQKYDGQWNPEDAKRLAGFPGTSWWDKSKVAGQKGIERITSDPGGFLALIPRKFGVLWANENYGADYSVDSNDDARVRPSLHLLSNIFYVALLLLAVAGAWAGRRDRKTAMLVILLNVLAVAAIHVFAEVTGRYHAYLVPLLCVLAGIGLATVTTRVANAREMRPAT